jgi:hypothetical protein
LLRAARSKLTYSNVVASLALFIALTGGTAIALSGSNTVFSDDIVQKNVRTGDIAPGAVTANRLDIVSFAQVAADQATSGGPGDLATVGPTASVGVPANGLVSVYAQVTSHGTDPADECSVLLSQDGAPANFPNDQILRHVGGALATHYTAPGSTNGTLLRSEAGWMATFPLTAGTHTFRLKYMNSSGPGPCHFSDRKLWVGVVQ